MVSQTVMVRYSASDVVIPCSQSLVRWPGNEANIVVTRYGNCGTEWYIDQPTPTYHKCNMLRSTYEWYFVPTQHTTNVTC